MAEQQDTPAGGWTVAVQTDAVRTEFRRPSQARITVRAGKSEVVVEANADGLRALAGHLVTLAGDGVPDGAHLHLEAGVGLTGGSAGLVLERDDEA
ncbi:hypothetical protein [Kitasatospora sp. NPDC094015]|uniref:Imm32 family immunity protein n=1 Tax=Kitasatospora sp. NPDC094015 TaxID=3155205 RepID=UPI00332A91A6